MEWVRLDGKPIAGVSAAETQFQVDNTICRGDMQKAGLAAPAPQGVSSAYRQGQAQGDVFIGCMAEHGYMRQAIQ